MDSITHIALGACIGEAAFSKQIGKKALILGAIAQSFPDVDIAASLWLSPTENLLFHRGFTHSIFFGLIAAIPLAFSVKKILHLQIFSLTKMSVFFCLQIWLHALLDTCNAYGTGLFEPFSHQRFSFHLLFVADPFFSLSIVIAFVALIILRNNHSTRRKWLFAGFIPAAAYLFYTIFNKVSIDNKIEQSLSDRHISYNSVIITPTPFNSLLWYVVAAADSGYFIGYRSVFDEDTLTTSFTYFQKNEDLLQKVDKATDIKQLIQFAGNYYTLEQTGDTLVFNVLRFGQVAGWENPKANFVFQYFLNPYYNNTLVVQRGRFKGWNKKNLVSMFNRIKGKN